MHQSITFPSTAASSLLFVSLLAGCGDDLVSRIMAQQDELARLVCERCPELRGGVAFTTESCLSLWEENRLSPTQEACIRQAHADHAASLEPFWECQYQADVDYERCVRALDRCTEDRSVYEACGDQRGAALSDCPIPPHEAAMATSECFPPEP